MKPDAPIYSLKRDARALAREAGIPLHAALDRIARSRGYRAWSHLVASVQPRHAARLAESLSPGELVLIGARPQQGKTLLGLELALAARGMGREGHVFTLAESSAGVAARLRDLGVRASAVSLCVDTSDDICAGYVIDRLSRAEGPVLAVIDYLQVLDQKRSHPELGAQVTALRDFARASGAVIAVTSQIDRAFDQAGARLPGISDIRLPNRLDLRLFDGICMLHEGRMVLLTPDASPAEHPA